MPAMQCSRPKEALRETRQVRTNLYHKGGYSQRWGTRSTRADPMAQGGAKTAHLQPTETAFGPFLNRPDRV